MAGVRLRLRHRSARHAEIRHGRPSCLLRRRPALAPPLWLFEPRRAHVERGSGRMKFTLSWLKEHLETDASLEAIVDMLTCIGLEVEGVEHPAEQLATFVVAEVLTAEPPPQADQQHILTLKPGDAEPVQAVPAPPK